MILRRVGLSTARAFTQAEKPLASAVLQEAHPSVCGTVIESPMAPAGLRELGLAGAMMLILIFRPAGLTGGRELPFPAFLGAALTPRSR